MSVVYEVHGVSRGDFRHFGLRRGVLCISCTSMLITMRVALASRLERICMDRQDVQDA